MKKYGLLDYGSGNFQSVWNALDYIGLELERVSSPCQLNNVSHIILPGVGAFPSAMDKLRQLNLLDVLREHVIEKQKPFLGICIGMQVLADLGTEYRECEGLGYIPGKVQRIDAAKYDLAVPHMGWNDLHVARECPLFDKLPESPSFYFVHSYHYRPDADSAIVAYCDYGYNITACVQQDNIFGVQFHPEKSQRDGLQLLKNFSKL